MEKEKIELILLNAWKKEDDEYSLVFSNKSLYLIEHYKTSLELPARGGIPGLAIGYMAHKIREHRKREIIYEQEVLKEMPLQDIQILARRSFDYSDMQNQTLIRGDDSGKILFEYPTMGKLLKTSRIEIGYPQESLNQISTYLDKYGFVTRETNPQLDI